MCIYYKNKPSLHYTTQEHIFPASIGGIQKLPRGFVSDEFNNQISGLERGFIKDGIISMARQILGPGKRGKLAPSKATKSKIQLLEHTDADHQYALGYTSIGKVYEIPHLVLNVKTGESSFSFSNTGKNYGDVVQDFKNKCEVASSLRMKTLIENKLPVDTIILGIQEGVEDHYDCFYAKHDLNECLFDCDIIKKVGAGISYNNEPSTDRYLPRVLGRANFKTDYLRVYGKMAFNFLAHLKGLEFVQDNQFDRLRNWIAYGGEYPFVSMNPKVLNPLLMAGVKPPDDSHIIYLSKFKDCLISEIFLYGGFNVSLILSNAYINPFDIDGFICDWRNRVEYGLLKYIGIFLRNSESFHEE